MVQGLLLDVDAATLTVWVNGERKGAMARPGMTDEHGEPMPRLEGPLRWAVDLGGRASVAAAGPLPPPVVTAEDLAEDQQRRQRELDEAGNESDESDDDG